MDEPASEPKRPSQADLALLRLVDGLPAMIAYWDRSGRCLFANRAYERWFGLTPREVMARSPREVLGSLYDANAPRIERALSGEEQIFENEVRDPQGGPPRWAQVRYVPDVVDGAVAGFSVLAVDITDRVKAQAELARKESALRNAQRLAQVGHWEWDPATDAVTWSEELYRIYDRDPSLPAPGYAELEPYHSPEAFARLGALVQRCMKTGEPYENETSLRRRDGTVGWILGRGEAVQDAEGNVVGLRGASMDITARKRLEEQVLQLQKVESIGRFAGGLAHDFNNLLTVMNAQIEAGLRAAGQGPAAAHLREALETSRRAAELTRSLLAFARKEPARPRVVDLNHELAAAESLLRSLVGSAVELAVEPAAGVAPVMVDPVQLHQVLTNLLLNAHDAMAGRGRITVTTEATTLDDAFCRAHPGARPGEYVCLTVADTGEGMSDEVRARIFEPFFTTKKAGEGTGLGLSIVHGIVTQQGGYVAVDSAQGKGTTFRLWFARFTSPRAGR